MKYSRATQLGENDQEYNEIRYRYSCKVYYINRKNDHYCENIFEN